MLAIRKRLEDRDEGFTLIELLIVVIIIGILASVAIPVFLNQRNRAYRSAVQSDLRNLAVEAETFFTDAQTYTGFVIPDQDPAAAGTQFGSPGVGPGRAAAAAGNITVTIPAGGASYCFSAFHDRNPTQIHNIRPGNRMGQSGTAGYVAC